MNLGNFLHAAGKGAKSFFSTTVTNTQATRAAARVEKMESRIETMRKATVISKDAGVRNKIQASSSREYLTRSLGKKQETHRGTSIARVDTGGRGGLASGGFGGGGMTMPSLPPKLPPMRPPTSFGR